MVWSVVQSKAAAVNTGYNVANAALTSGAPAVTTVAGNTLIVILWGDQLGGASPVITDSAGNTYEQDVSDLSVGRSLAVYACHNSLSVNHAGGSFTVTLGGAPTSNAFWGFYVIEANPGAGNVGAFDVSIAGAAGTTNNPGAGPTPQTVQGAALVLGVGFFISTNQNVSVGGSYTGLGSDSFATGVLKYGVYPATQTPSSAASTYTFQAETDGGVVSGSVAVCVVFKVAGATGAPAASLQTGGKSLWWANDALSIITGSTRYLALVTATPGAGDTGATITEATYTGYARKAVAAGDWGGISGGAAANANALAFAACTGGSSTVVGWVLLDSATIDAGNALYWGVISPGMAVANGVTVEFFAGQLVLVET